VEKCYNDCVKRGVLQYVTASGTSREQMERYWPKVQRVDVWRQT